MEKREKIGKKARKLGLLFDFLVAFLLIALMLFTYFSGLEHESLTGLQVGEDGYEVVVQLTDREQNTVPHSMRLESNHKGFAAQSSSSSIQPGVYDVHIEPVNHSINHITLQDVPVTQDQDFPLKLDELDDKKWNDYVRIYAIDPSQASFEQATVEVTAQGNVLYKCPSWDFENQLCPETCEVEEDETECSENWIKIKDITPGADYNFALSPQDPGFAESSEAVDVALAPIDNTSFVIAWIDSVEGDLSFRIMNTSGQIIINTTDVDTTVDTNSRVSISAINSTHFALAWVDGVSANITRAIYLFNGTQVLPPTEVYAPINDTQNRYRIDVSVAQLGDRFVVCYANDADNDAQFNIFNNAGTEIVGTTNVDNNMAPNQYLENLLECSAINNTRWVYFWFDDAGATGDDATFFRRDELGAALGSAVDEDDNIGVNGQVAIANLDNDKFAMVWHDDSATDEDITISVRDADGNVVLAPTDIDSDVGSESRVAIAAVRQTPSATTDSFIVVWWDNPSSDIKASVFDGTGTQITLPFTVDTQQDTTYRLLDVSARDPITGNSLCPGKFIVAYTNSSDAGIFKGFDVDGSSWDGNCTIADTLPPASVTNLANQSQSLTSIFWNWTNPLDPDFSLALVFLDGQPVTTTASNFYNATNLTPGTTHTLTVHTKDTSGNINDTDVNSTSSTLVDIINPSVTLLSPVPNSSFNVSDFVSIAATVTDNGVIDTVRATIVSPNGTTQTIFLSESSASLYGTSFRIPFNEPGQYNITLIANDTVNNFNNTETTFFVATSLVSVGFVQRDILSLTTSIIEDALVPINTSKSFVRFRAMTNDSSPNDWQFTTNLSDTTVTFTRYDGGGLPATISWEVIEHEDITVQRGVETLSVGQNQTAAALTNVNVSKSFVIVHGRCGDNRNGDTHAGFFLANLTSSTTLDVRRGNGDKCAASVSWQVVEWDGASVQSGEEDIASNADSTAASISAVNLSSSFLIFGSASLGDDEGADSNLIKGNFSSSSQVFFTHEPGSIYNNSKRLISWFVVELPGSTIQAFDVGLSSDTNQPLTSLNESATFHLSSGWNSRGGQSYTNTLFTSEITSPTNLLFDKLTDSATQQLSTFVIEIPPPLTPIISWNQSSLDLGQVLISGGTLQENASLDSFKNNNNITVACSSGNCTTISDDWIDGTNLSNTQSLQVAFNCTDSVVGVFSAFFNVTSNQDTQPDQIAVSCEILPPINIAWNQSSLDLGTDERGFGNITQNVSVTSSGTNTNITVNCVSGNCSHLSTDWVNGTNLTDTQVLQTVVTCLDTDIANLSANFELISNEDSLPSTLNTTCEIIDTTPPASVTNLANQSQTLTSIFWNWTNPLDTDFNNSLVFLDGVNVINTTNDFYNTTGLVPGTVHTLTVFTSDHLGNVNTTNVSSTASTQIDLQPPSVVILQPSLNATFNVSDFVHIRVNVTDNSVVDTVVANVVYPNTTLEQVVLEPVSADIYNSSFRVPLNLPGQYNITILANDTVNNLNNTQTTSFVASLLVKQGFVQTGSVFGNTSLLVDAIAQVNQSKSVILFTSRSDDSSPDDWQFTPSFLDSSSIRFERYDGFDVNTTLSWQVIEHNSFSVQRGSENMSVNQNTTQVSLSLVNLSETFVLVNGRCADDRNGDSHAGLFAARFINASELLIQRGNGDKCVVSVSWQVIEWDGASVQSGELLIANNTDHVGAPITTVNTSKALLVFGSASFGDDEGMDSNLIAGSLTSSSVNFTHEPGSVYNDSVRLIDWYVVEIPSGIVQSGGLSLTADTNITIANINQDNSFIASSGWNSRGGQSYANSLYTSQFTSSTNIFFNKQTISGTQQISWFATQIDNRPPLQPSLIEPSNGTITADNTTFFDWTDSLDPDLDPVLYTLQIDNDSDFSSLQIEKTNLTSSMYTLLPGEALSDGVYYWRVFANDSLSGSVSGVFTFEINPTLAISLSLSSSLSSGINWTLVSLPTLNQSALGNNGSGVTEYDVAISAVGTTVDLYIKADDDLRTVGNDTIGLGNETFSYNLSNSSVPTSAKFSLTTNYSDNLVVSGISNGTQVFFKFFLSAPASQAPGTYSNNVSITGVPVGAQP